MGYLATICHNCRGKTGKRGVLGPFISVCYSRWAVIVWIYVVVECVFFGIVVFLFAVGIVGHVGP